MTLDDIRDSLENMAPSALCTCSPEGVPNVCFISQVEYVDAHHVALSFQFFNKTRQNVLANPKATVAISDRETALLHQVSLTYLRTETAGPVFERMKAKLASIAHATGMAGVFRLRGADLYRVDDIEVLPGVTLPRAPRRNSLAALRACSDAMARQRELGPLIDVLLEGLACHFGIAHAMVLAIDRPGERFYTLASHGYGQSGVGAEIPLGVGAVGVAALARVPIRLPFAAAEYAYVRAIRESASQDPVWASRLELAIPFPGLAAPHSQLAVPIEVEGVVLGVLYVESASERRFTYEDEDALVTLARLLGPALRGFEPEDARTPSPSTMPRGGQPLGIKYFAENSSVFFDDDYVIRGVAGAICFKLLKLFVDEGRTEFTNRELRLDRDIGLPEIGDNLEARLLLLERRLREKDAGVRIERTKRGRLSLVLKRPISLVEAGG